MIFWDASAIVPLCVDQPATPLVRAILETDSVIAAWWGSPVECYSAWARLRREGFLTDHGEGQSRRLLSLLAANWTEIEPSREVRDLAGRILLLHPLRAADSLQLAAALVWAGKSPAELSFACLDRRLRDAAHREGFGILPTDLP